MFTSQDVPSSTSKRGGRTESAESCGTADTDAMAFSSAKGVASTVILLAGRPRVAALRRAGLRLLSGVRGSREGRHHGS
nr:hypothetical protein [Mycobacterium uberis]